MKHIQLFTNDHKFVHSSEIPPFVSDPEVVIWGQRIFKYESEGKYIEVFAWCIPTLHLDIEK